MNEQTQPKPDAENAQRMLREYVEGGRCERVFARLVTEFGSLVYSSAYRRTGCPQLAEEVAQNVFGVLARRAKSLRRHPSLVGWLYQTTRHQSTRAMRSERRHRRKLDALKQELVANNSQKISPSGANLEPWRDALPELDRALDRLSERDRNLLVERFFLGLRFREIAERSGRSDAACKMAVKRALERLSRTLSSRGVTLTVTVLGSCLGAELGRAVPAAVLGNVTSGALSAAPSLGFGGVFANQFQTMGAVRMALLVGAAVLVLVAPSLLTQAAQARQLERELVELSRQTDQPLIEERPLTAIIPSTPLVKDAVGDLLAARDEPFDEANFLRDVGMASWSGDEYLKMRCALQLSVLGRGELLALSEKTTQQGIVWWAEAAAELLEDFLVEGDVTALDRMVRSGLRYSEELYLERLERWAAGDPDTALAWFAGLQDEGVFENPEDAAWTYAYVLRGLVAQDPERAEQLMRAEPNAEYRDYMASQIAEALVQTVSGELPRDILVRLFNGMESENSHRSVFRQVVGTIKGRESAEAAAAFVELVESTRTASEAAGNTNSEVTE